MFWVMTSDAAPGVIITVFSRDAQGSKANTTSLT